ncbi:12345_t:CDS:1, partial [Funneliformis geosporum]
MESKGNELPLILFSKVSFSLKLMFIQSCLSKLIIAPIRFLLSYGRFQHAKGETWSPSLD